MERRIKQMLKIAYSKPDTWFVAKSVKAEKNCKYGKYIFRESVTRVSDGKK